MMMRITRSKLYPGMWPMFAAAHHATAATTSQETKGLRGCWLAQDIDDPDAGYTVTLWDTLEDMQAYEQSGAFQEALLTSLRPLWGEQYTTYHRVVQRSQEGTTRGPALVQEADYWEDFALFR